MKTPDVKQVRTMGGTTERKRGEGLPIAWLLERPIAHRGLHDLSAGAPENTLAAALAAAERGYSIEVDLHLSSDGVPVVFHDDLLDRLTGEQGSVRDRTAAQLAALPVAGTLQHIPTLDELLAAIGARTGLVVELKGVAGRDDGFAEAVAERLARYDGPVAAMSFKHWLLRDLHALGTGIPLGLTAEGDDRTYGRHRDIDKEIGFDFLSYGLKDLPCRFATEFIASGRPMIVWTVRTPQDADFARQQRGQITFENFLP
jgi:glycerophosphoryl diester phosphodiesterase